MRNSYSGYHIICNNVFHNILLLRVTSHDILRGAALICGHSFCHHKKGYNKSLDITPLYPFISVRSLRRDFWVEKLCLSNLISYL